MKAKRISFAALLLIPVLIASVAGVFLLERKVEQAPPPPVPPAPGPRLVMSMEGFRFTRSEQGWVSWLMHARNADLYENKEAKLQDVEILFKKQGRDRKEAILRGEQATMDTTNGNASIRRGSRDVRIITSDGYLLTTASLYWRAGEKSVWTDDAFRLLGDKIYLEGIGLSANVNLRTLVVKDNVKAVLEE